MDAVALVHFTSDSLSLSVGLHLSVSFFIMYNVYIRSDVAFSFFPPAPFFFVTVEQIRKKETTIIDDHLFDTRFNFRRSNPTQKSCLFNTTS